MYKIIDEATIHRLGDGAHIPVSDSNSDYQRYLEWVALGNKPEPTQTEAEILADVSAEARLQRDAELSRADIMLNRVQDGETGLGTQKAWRAYRVLLRDWPSTEGFPEAVPVAPDAK